MAPLSLGGVVPPELEQSVVAGLVKNVKEQGYHQTVGSVGAKLLLNGLAESGNADTAMRIATQTTFPSFGYWLSLGATTCWENYRCGC
jgi:alpha-L-rhamnosidase